MPKVRDKFEKKARSLVENVLVREYFNNKKNGYFVEVGANEPTHHGSQTWHLEKTLQWTGILVEPIPQLAEQCREHRPNARVFECACVGTNEVQTITLYIPYGLEDNKEIFSRSAIGINIDAGKFRQHKEIAVQARTLNSILKEAEAKTIDLLSIDVEGAELEVLFGIDLKKFSPRLILLEDKHLYLTKHRYLKKNGYCLVKRTRQNCWYVPKEAKRPPQTLFEKIRLFKRMYISIWSKKLAYSLRHKTLKPFQQL